MRTSSSCIWAALFLLIGVCAAQGPAPDCSAALVSLLPCLDYVQGNVSSPSQTCCVGVNTTVQNTPSCLCSLFNSSALPINVDPARASQLPALCNVTAPSTSLCGGSGAPVQAPVAPVASPPGSVAPVQEPVPSPPASPAIAPASAPPAPLVPTAPVVPPSTPLTPSSPPSTTPSSTPVGTPAVSPTAPTAEVPAPASLSTASPGTSPSEAPAVAPSSESPLPSLTSPPSPPPASDNNSHGSAIAASFLVSSAFAMLLSGILFV